MDWLIVIPRKVCETGKYTNLGLYVGAAVGTGVGTFAFTRQTFLYVSARRIDTMLQTRMISEAKLLAQKLKDEVSKKSYS